VRVWLNKLDDPKAWDQEFWFNKPTQLFDGLPLLHGIWKQLSNMGSHAKIVSMSNDFIPLKLMVTRPGLEQGLEE
jgi:hypothetical protein